MTLHLLKKVKFGKKTLQANIFTIKQVINESAIFDIVDVTGFIYNLQPKETYKKDAKTLRIREGVVIVLFNPERDEVSNDTCYDFKKMRIHGRVCFNVRGNHKCVRK